MRAILLALSLLVLAPGPARATAPFSFATSPKGDVTITVIERDGPLARALRIELTGQRPLELRLAPTHAVAGIDDTQWSPNGRFVLVTLADGSREFLDTVRAELVCLLTRDGTPVCADAFEGWETEAPETALVRVDDAVVPAKAWGTTWSCPADRPGSASGC